MSSLALMTSLAVAVFALVLFVLSGKDGQIRTGR